jgi:hypothetical protein
MSKKNYRGYLADVMYSSSMLYCLLIDSSLDSNGEFSATSPFASNPLGH